MKKQNQEQEKFQIASKKDQAEQIHQQIPFFTIIPATEKAKDYIIKLKQKNDDLQDIIIQLEVKIKNLEERLSKYEVIE
jgi:hypothetical protein